MKRLTLLILATVLASCATTKTTKETVAFQGDFANYNTVAVQLEPNPQIEAKHAPEAFSTLLTKLLAEKKLFKSVAAHSKSTGAELLLKVKIKELDAPGGATAVLMQSFANSEVTVDCRFVENKAAREVASLEAMGNSKLMPRSSMGGYGLTSVDTYTARAYENAAEAIVDFIVAHHSGAKKG